MFLGLDLNGCDSTNNDRLYRKSLWNNLLMVTQRKKIHHDTFDGCGWWHYLKIIYVFATIHAQPSSSFT